MIEVYKHQFQDLNDVIAQIKNRNYKFIIYMDDLSFEEFEIEYKYLKAVIEGGLEKKPENVLIYATSNRSHLIRETFQRQRGEQTAICLLQRYRFRRSCPWHIQCSDCHDLLRLTEHKKQFQEIVPRLWRAEHGI